MCKVINEQGNRYGRLYVICEAGRNKWGKDLWLCMCDCGEFKTILGCNLRNDNTNSCGCLRKEIMSKRYKGKKLSEEICKKMSENHGDVSGENNPAYNPNLTDEGRQDQRHIPGYDNWRSAVYERDNYTCQKCGDNKGGNLIAHHIESYRPNPELRTTVENGITFCETCHLDFHHRYGYGNNTREQLNEFLGVKQ